MSEWISVKDRLPEESGRYLTADMSMRSGNISTIDYYASGGWNWFDNNRNTEIEVTHWMPLPEPPADESKYGGEGIW